jgi:hypothetical protein
MKSKKPKTDRKSPWIAEFVGTPAIDFESIMLKKSQRIPKGYHVVRITAAELPKGWPPPSPTIANAGAATRTESATGLRYVTSEKQAAWFSAWCRRKALDFAQGRTAAVITFCCGESSEIEFTASATVLA